MYGAAIGAGLGMLGKLAQGSGPEYKPNRALRERMANQQKRYQDMTEGKGPSLGRQLLQQGLQQGMNQQQAAAASARGGALQQRLGQRTAQMQGAQMAGRSAQQAAQLRAQEQQAAMSSLDRSMGEQERREQMDYERRRQRYDDQSLFAATLGLGADQIMNQFNG